MMVFLWSVFVVMSFHLTGQSFGERLIPSCYRDGFFLWSVFREKLITSCLHDVFFVWSVFAISGFPWASSFLRDTQITKCFHDFFFWYSWTDRRWVLAMAVFLDKLLQLFPEFECYFVEIWTDTGRHQKMSIRTPDWLPVFFQTEVSLCQVLVRPVPIFSAQ